MIATVDDNLLFYDEINPYKKNSSETFNEGKKFHNLPKKQFSLDHINVIPRDNGSLIDIIEKIPGLLFNSTQK